MPNPTKPQKVQKVEKKKQEIVTAAREVFSQYDYKNTTVDDIGKQISLNQASLYYCSKNKEELFAMFDIKKKK